MDRSPRLLLAVLLSCSLVAVAAQCGERLDLMKPDAQKTIYRTDPAQARTWTPDDLEFFMHGSLGTEVFPERILAAFKGAYPDLFPGDGMTHYGLIADENSDLPLGISRRRVPHLANLPSLGINCASCHLSEVRASKDATPQRILGGHGLFDPASFFGAMTIGTFWTADPARMEKFLVHYLEACDPSAGEAGRAKLAAEIERQRDAIAAAVSNDPFGMKNVARGELHPLKGEDLELSHASLEKGADLPRLSTNILRLFHNMRTALHIPDTPPSVAPPSPGPGRTDAFGLLSAVLFNLPTNYAPVKFGVVFNVEGRGWVHWDGNNRSPAARNVEAALGLGAPVVNDEGWLDIAMVDRHTDLTERIRAPKYPFPIDANAARRGAAYYQSFCASCHNTTEYKRLFAPDVIGTDANRAKQFTQQQADLHNDLLARVKIANYKPEPRPPYRSTGKYWAPDLAGVWARAPYLHNGSVRTMTDLLTHPDKRIAAFRKGTTVYDQANMGFANEGSSLFEITADGNAATGHNFGTFLHAQEKRDLVEYLKTL